MDRIKAIWVNRSGGYECSHCGVLSDEPFEMCPHCDSDMKEYDDEV